MTLFLDNAKNLVGQGWTEIITVSYLKPIVKKGVKVIVEYFSL